MRISPADQTSLPIHHHTQSTIDSEGFKGGTRGAPIMPRDAVSRTANVDITPGQAGYVYIYIYIYTYKLLEHSSIQLSQRFQIE